MDANVNRRDVRQEIRAQQAAAEIRATALPADNLRNTIERTAVRRAAIYSALSDMAHPRRDELVEELARATTMLGWLWGELRVSRMVAA